MTPSPVSSSADAHVTCVAAGDITSTNEAAFRAQLDHTMAAAPAGWRVLALDLRATRMIDSKGLNLIVSTVKRLRAEGREVHFVAPQAPVRRVLVFTRLDRHGTVVEQPGVAS